MQLVRWARRRKSSQALALRSRIVLESATGAANTVVAERLGVSRPTVGKWRARFLEHRLDGLVDDPRPGRPATVTAEQVEDVVAELGLQDWVAGLPDGLSTRLGPGGVTLSAGEEQLLAFARLLARDVRIVVLDEATARMDPLTESRVVRASERLLSGRTGVLVAHRLSTIRDADRIAVLDAGRIVRHIRQVEADFAEAVEEAEAAAEAEGEDGDTPAESE